ncbi:MAG: TonB-dependent receptor plug domain-containing protein [Chlorobi bacterium]|nr:TonB-dependent receptor plug domain-containing protein [Chlorobiota bacterium]MCI0715672.1 TonB-dependent receptor plug domain-containing protein [Chlorobiota bacterium]
MHKFYFLLFFVFVNAQIISQDFKDSIKSKFELPQIDIIGRRQGLINRIPGSIYRIGNEQLKLISPISGNEVFKRAAGINVVDEEGMGLRLNLGIRGLDPDRSRTILVLEDGIPVSIAPYGEPEMYYTPPIDKMSGIEVLKGSGSILFGPQTIAGVINYLTTDPPQSSTASLTLKGGQDGIFFGKLGYGTTHGNVGFLLNAFRKQGDNVGVLRYRISDANAKFKIAFSKKSTLGVKVAAYDEVSNATYVGITQVMYERGEYYPILPENDNLDVRRYTASITHDYKISENSSLVTTIYGYNTDRIWRRQDFSRTFISNATRIWGDTTISGGSIYMRSTTGIRDRRFQVAGIEPRFFISYEIGKIKNELDMGIRYHYERAFEKRINGSKPDAESGALVSDEIRTGNAFSGFVQNRFYFTKNLTVTPGIRYESFFFDRNILRNNSRDTNVLASSDNFQLIPGLGISYYVNKKINLFTGIHRGHAPPRIKDAINTNGEVTELDAELSWNTELGVRANLINPLYFELTGYYLDFSNQVIPVSVSSGGTGSGLVNGGKTKHFGVEAGFSIDFGKFFSTNYNIILSSNATFSRSKYNSDRFITRINGSDTNITNVRDNDLPYAPNINLTASLEFLSPVGFDFLVTGNYVGKQFTDELNMVLPSNDGLTGELSSRFIIDLTARYTLKKFNSSLYISIKNLSDERYIASRRPQGIKVGLPRVITAGIDLKF